MFDQLDEGISPVIEEKITIPLTISQPEITSEMNLIATIRCAKMYAEQKEINRLRSEKGKQEIKLLRAKYKKKIKAIPVSVSIYQIEESVAKLNNFIKQKHKFIQRITP